VIPPGPGDTAAILLAIADVAEQVRRLSKHLGL